MTYLDLVNNVLRRMREDEVSNISENTYSKMVGDFVNDAKKLVENTWDWSALRTVKTISTVDGTYVYAIADSKDTYKDLTVVNDTDNIFMEYRPQSWFEEQYFINTPAEGSPQYYTYDSLDSNGDTQISVYPKPDAVYSIRINAVIRNDDLVNNTDNLVIPSAPVVHLALAMLARERGETGVTSTPEYFAIADKYLSDAVALDAQKVPDQTVWYTP